VSDARPCKLCGVSIKVERVEGKTIAFDELATPTLVVGGVAMVHRLHASSCGKAVEPAPEKREPTRTPAAPADELDAPDGDPVIEFTPKGHAGPAYHDGLTTMSRCDEMFLRRYAHVCDRYGDQARDDGAPPALAIGWYRKAGLARGWGERLKPKDVADDLAEVCS